MILVSVEYADNYRLKGEDYTGIMMSIPEYDRFAQLYGPKVSKVLLTRIRNIVIDAMPKNIVVAHTGSGVFVCFQKGLDTGTLRQRTEAVKKRLPPLRTSTASPARFPCAMHWPEGPKRGHPMNFSTSCPPAASPVWRLTALAAPSVIPFSLTAKHSITPMRWFI